MLKIIKLQLHIEISHISLADQQVTYILMIQKILRTVLLISHHPFAVTYIILQSSPEELWVTSLNPSVFQVVLRVTRMHIYNHYITNVHWTAKIETNQWYFNRLVYLRYRHNVAHNYEVCKTVSAIFCR